MEDLQAAAVCEPDQSAEVERIVALVMKAMESDVRRIAQGIVLKRDDQLLGPGEFDLRNKMLGMARHIVEATVNDRKKGGTKVPARSVPTAAKAPVLSNGGAKHS